MAYILCLGAKIVNMAMTHFDEYEISLAILKYGQSWHSLVKIQFFLQCGTYVILTFFTCYCEFNNEKKVNKFWLGFLSLGYYEIWAFKIWHES